MYNTNTVRSNNRVMHWLHDLHVRLTHHTLTHEGSEYIYDNRHDTCNMFILCVQTSNFSKAQLICRNSDCNQTSLNH